MSMFLIRLRLQLSIGLMWLLCWLSDRSPLAPEHPGFYRSRILFGPLSGCHLFLQRLERPSMLLGTYESHVVAAMRQYVRPGQTVYDIGTHVGYMSTVLAKLVGPTGRVVAFKPDPTNRQALAQNIVENALNQVTIVPAAVSDRSGEAHFAHFETYSLVGHLAQEHEPGDAELLLVSTVTLDAYVYENNHPAPTFIKLDVEGAEIQVLAGARRLLMEARPIIVVEMRARFKQELADLLEEVGYRLEVLQGTEIDWQRWGLADVLLLPQSGL